MVMMTAVAVLLKRLSSSCNSSITFIEIVVAGLHIFVEAAAWRHWLLGVVYTSF